MHLQISSSFYMKEDFPFSILRISHDFQHTPEVHGHEFIELVYVASGEATHFFEGDQYKIREGDIFIINPGEVHTYSFEIGQQIEIINCLFMPALIHDSLLRELGISHSMDYFYVHPFLKKSDRFNHRLNLNGQEADTVLTILEHMIKEWTNRSSGYSTIIRLQMIELLILLSRYYGNLQKTRTASRQGAQDILVRRIRGYLERNYDQKITLSQLSSLFNISERQLNRLIKSKEDLSVIELLHDIRLERAKHFLLETDEKVAAIAAMVGYEDPAFFSRLFGRKVGCSPGKYRTGPDKNL